MSRGIVVSTGKVADAADLGMREGTDFPPVGVAGDDISLEFQFKVLQETSVEFKYVFASREIPLYGGEKNDRFSMTTYNRFAKCPPPSSVHASSFVRFGALLFFQRHTIGIRRGQHCQAPDPKHPDYSGHR